MRPADLELLQELVDMPFIDRLELAAMSGMSRSAVYETVRRLEAAGLVASIPHAADLTPPTRRYRITGTGLRAVAKAEDSSLDDLLRSRPVSAQWLRILTDRLDALAVVYRLASTVAAVAFPIGLRLYRSGPLDAAMTLPGGRTLGIARQGHASDRTGFSRRLWKLGQGESPGTVFVLATDEVRLRHARRMTPRRVNGLLALEQDAVLAAPEDPVWLPSASGPATDLRNALDQLQPGGEIPVEAPPSAALMPEDSDTNTAPALPVLLRPAEKRALDLIFDWPWMSRTELASLMVVSTRRVSQIVNPLEGFGLVTRPIKSSGRLALTDRGIALLARRDRTSVAVARRRWSVALQDGDAPCEWRNVSGGRTRQLLRNVQHTDAVHAFIASLARQANTLGWQVVQIDPPKRASRHFRHEGRRRSVNPDAFGLLGRGPAAWAFFLEWERRAVRPSTMATRLAPYLRYYSSHGPIDDHGVRPAVLIVFDDDLAAANFLRVARREMDRTGVGVPLWVSHREAIASLGPLGRTWRTPHDWEPAHVLRNR
ncbi:MAG: winged helix-turn-helix transcriptional regulator [bacterium]|nr:winged helix-turn-helix transcriptional regulator [bacterium]